MGTKQRWPKYQLGLIILFLLLFLTGCVTHVPLLIEPPPDLLIDTHVPSVEGVVTNADLVEYIRELQEAVLSCNIDKESLRYWVGSLQVDGLK